MRFFIVLCAPFIYIVSLLFKKDNNIWLYGAWFGKMYKDNSRCFFEDANKLLPEITHIWIYKSYEVKKNIPKKYKSLYAYSLKGLLIQLKAKVFICTLNTSDFIPFFVTYRNIIIQLWHGSPLKHIGIDSRKTSIRRFIDKIRFKTLDRYTYCISPSQLFDNCFISAFLLDKNSILRTLYPRNKSLFISEEKKMKIRKSLDIANDERFIMYLPTHRNEGVNSNLADEVKKLYKNNRTFSENKVKFIIKPHFYEWKNFQSHHSLDSIKILFDDEFDLYELLASSDLLVTDYSSVFFDYELLKKPIIIYPYDIEKYKSNDRDFYFQYDFIYNNLLNTKVIYSENDLVKCCINPIEKKLFKQNRISIFNQKDNEYPNTLINAIQKKLI